MSERSERTMSTVPTRTRIAAAQQGDRGSQRSQRTMSTVPTRTRIAAARQGDRGGIR
ncbi:MAG TPA: hypothetical protein VNV66_00855 [Pilimelia sp.]|nr:hypothetical protein [Pilimelia sp.]